MRYLFGLQFLILLTSLSCDRQKPPAITSSSLKHDATIQHTLETSYVDLAEWLPPKAFVDEQDMRQQLGVLHKAFESGISFVEDVALVEIRDTGVDETPYNLMIIYRRANSDRVYRRRLTALTKNYYPLSLRSYGKGKLEVIEVKPTATEPPPLGFVFDISILH